MVSLRNDIQPMYLPAPVEAVTGVWQFIREPWLRATARSLPGHLLHLATAGHYQLKTNGREYAVKAGDIVYYHESEEVEWLGDESQVVFYSIGFLAPGLKPLPIEQRVFPANARLNRLFAQLCQAWNGDRETNRFAIHARLADILDEIWRHRFAGILEEPSAARQKSWWQVESILRERHQFRPSLEDLCAIGRLGRSTLIRSCRQATGKPPILRLREIRMEEARGLLLCSHLNVSQVAQYLGYPRIHEFSREFSAFHGFPPSQLQKT
jgi:AraC-like DNA-binding protein